MKTKPKEYLLGVLSGASAVATLMLWNFALPQILSGDISYRDLTTAVIILLTGSCLFALAALFVKNPWVLYATASLFGVFPLFLVDLGGNSVAFVLLPLFFSVFAVFRMQNENRYSCGFNALRNMRAGLPYFFTSLAFSVSIFYFSGIRQDEVASLILPRPAFDFSVKILREPLERISGIPSLDSQENVDGMLLMLLDRELQKKNLRISDLPGNEIEKLLSAERNEISKRYGIKITGKEKISDVFYRTVAGRIEDFAKPYKSYLPYLSALAFFFAFKAFTWPLYIISVLITAALIRLLIKSKILTKVAEDIRVERVRLT